MSRRASTTGTFCSLIRPPARPRTDFFSDLFLASKMGNSTEAPRTSMLTIRFLSRACSHPVRDAGAVVAQGEQRQGPPDDGDPADDRPVCPALHLADQRRPE